MLVMNRKPTITLVGLFFIVNRAVGGGALHICMRVIA